MITIFNNNYEIMEVKIIIINYLPNDTTTGFSMIHIISGWWYYD